MNKLEMIEMISNQWESDRWKNTTRDYLVEDVVALRGSKEIEYSVAKAGAEKLWQMLNEDGYVFTFGTYTGSRAVQMVRAGMRAIYLSGWQTAADANLAGQTYPDQSLYPANSVPEVVNRLNKALRRADEIEWEEKGEVSRDWLVPIVADAEAGFGGPLQAYELMKAMIEGGASGVHFEDQLAAEKKCGHLGGKVLVPTSQFVKTLRAARLAADVMGTSTILVARTDAESATLLTSDIDPYDLPFITGERTEEGYYLVRNGLTSAIARGLAYAPYADMVWCETKTPNLEEARKFAEAIHEQFPGKKLAYNCSPSFNWRKYMSIDEILGFQEELGKMGYKFNFVTLWEWHSNNLHSFNEALAYQERGMAAYIEEVQDAEFAAEENGYTATKHQREVGAGYFDRISMAVSKGRSSTTALKGSTEEEQFKTE